MAVDGETAFVYAFAALLAVGSAVILFVPLVQRLRLSAAPRGAHTVVLVVLGVLSLAAFVGVVAAASNPAVFLPLVAVTVALRLTSPTLLYFGVRSRLEAHRLWGVIRLALVVMFAVFAVLLTYNLLNHLAGQDPPGIAGLSEQLGMAVGASFLILRTGFRFRPQFTMELLPVWLSTLAFAVAFVVIAPYAFPVFAIAYVASGLIGWIAAIIILRFSD